jgi:DNA (cytosine-5)-methyltransferase 1
MVRESIIMKGLDIFCGAGGSSAGARAAGVELVGAIDMCPIATDTYRANFQDTIVLTECLEKIDLSALRRKIGMVDILIASPECTNHTCAKGSAPRDEASRATALHVVTYASVFKPRWFVLENVVHMRPWARFDELKYRLEELGYEVAEQVLDASDFGVPQTRRRLFLVGDRKHKPQLVERKHPGRRRTAKSVLDTPGAWDTSPLYEAGRAEGTLARAKRAMTALGKSSSFLIVYYGSDGSGGWQPLSRPLRTVTTIDRFALIESDSSGPRIRMLQVPELHRAMGFEKNFAFPIGTRRERIRMLGNSVCPPVMTEVIRALVA